MKTKRMVPKDRTKSKRLAPQGEKKEANNDVVLEHLQESRHNKDEL